jgi:hypothetical protein
MIGMGLGLGLTRRRRAAGVRRLLDNLTLKPDAAHSSSRLLSSLYGGPILRALREDGNELDIFANSFGELDKDAAIGHVYSGTTAILGDASGYAKTGAEFYPGAWSTLHEQGTNGSHRISKALNIALTAGVQYRLAIIARRTGTAARNVTLVVFGGGIACGYTCNFDNLTASITDQGNVSGLSASVTPILHQGQSAFLCVVNFTPNLSVGSAVYIEAANGAARTYLGASGSGLIFTTPGIFTAAGLSSTIRTWYDLMGGGKHAEQTNAAQQFRLVNGGTLDLKNGRPLLFGGVNVQTSMASPVPMREPSTQVCVTSRVTGAVRWGNSVQRGSGGFPEDQFTVGFGQFIYDGAVRASPGTVGLPSTLDLQVGVTTLNNNNSYNRWDNGVARGAAAKGGIVTTGNFVIGNTSNRVQSLNGFAAEYMFFQGSLSDTDRQLIEADQKAYYGTP